MREILKEGKPRESPMNDVEGSKGTMILNYAKENSLDSTLGLCKKKMFGNDINIHQSKECFNEIFTLLDQMSPKVR